MILKKIINTFVLLLKIFFFDLRAILIKKKPYVILVAEFGTEGGALTYFKYILEYFETKQISYVLVLSKEQKLFVENKINITYCMDILEGPDVWRPYFTEKNKLSYNLDLLINQLLELLFFSKLNVKYRPAYFYFSVTNPEHYVFEFCMTAKLFYVCHTLTNDAMDTLKYKILNTFLQQRKNIIVVSHSAKKFLLKSWKIKTGKAKYIKVIYNYYNTIPNDDVKKGKTKEFTVLTIGSVEPYKNPLLWCEVAKKMTEVYGIDKVKFFWLGNGSSKNECQQIVSSYPNIIFLGFCKNVESFYNISDVYMQPSISESFGISVVGAMAHKIPCVVSNAGGLIEVVDNDETGFVINEKNSEIYFNKLSHLLINPVEKIKMGESGYFKFRNEFTKQHWYKNMDKLLFCDVER